MKNPSLLIWVHRQKDKETKIATMVAPILMGVLVADRGRLNDAKPVVIDPGEPLTGLAASAPVSRLVN